MPPGRSRWATKDPRDAGSSLAITVRGRFPWSQRLRSRVFRREPRLLRLYPPGSDHAVLARPNTSDLAAFEEVFGGAYDITLSPEPRTIFDLGANVGYASVAFALRYPGARVLAVEPEPSNATLARRNVASLPVDVVEAAVWPRESTLFLRDSGKGRWGFQVREALGEGRPVRAITMDALMELAGVPFVDLAKIDIEGSELELFSENTGWLENVGVVAIELHDRLRSGCGEALREALERAQAQFHQDRRGDTLVLTRVR